VRIALRLGRQKRINRSWQVDFLLFILLGLFGAFMAIPLIYTINNAFKPLDELFLFPPTIFVRNPTFNNFPDLFHLMAKSWVPFSRYIFNTVFITLVGTVGHVILASAAAYPLAKYNFRGSKSLFTIIVLSLMFSSQVTAIPNFMTMSWLGWVDTYWAVIIPAFAFPLGLYLMKQFIEQIPMALIESAKIDGANEYRIFWTIVMPLVKPAWYTLIILLFQMLWATDGGGFIYSEELKTMHFAMGQIAAGGIARAGVAAAVALLLMVVPIVMFVITQSKIIQTMASSGIKE
jgi:ABC-type glycerol-3-phosphate transport system permease component